MADAAGQPAADGGEPPRRGLFSRQLLALILGQISLHACMTGLRMAAPLQALQQGRSEWAVGVVLALFAIAPIALAMPAGRMADRHGYHRPLGIAVALTFAGGVAATLSPHYIAMCIAALLAGAGANIGLIAIQHRAGNMAAGNIERIRIFSWLGLAPALSNVLGPVTAGLLIDLAGFRVAFAVLGLMPLAALAWARFVPREPPQVIEAAAEALAQAQTKARRAWDLLQLPAMRRLLLVNLLLSASWDVHTFVLPILGHQRELSASEIGAVLGVFAMSVAAVRVLIPMLAERLSESQVLAGAMLATAAIFVAYPFAHQGWSMALCAMLLGMALGSVQPMIMSRLHQITPDRRHGEAIGLRSVTINLSSSLMPLLFGLLGATIGAASLFWLMALAVGAGSLRARRL
ncbi:MFS transporter [Piscinibacter sakaiensis]|uniref:MFS transporter n=1 Tax=Piscinibacter sakaiensis TaxID=1547922 RepID=UPI003AAF3B87